MLLGFLKIMDRCDNESKEVIEKETGQPELHEQSSHPAALQPCSPAAPGG